METTHPNKPNVEAPLYSKLIEGENVKSISKASFVFYLDFGKPGCFLEDLGFSHEDYGQSIMDELNSTSCAEAGKPTKLFINHEHREADTSKPEKPLCHYQAFLKVKINRRIKGRSFSRIINGDTFLTHFDLKPTNNAKKAENYCKKTESRYPGTKPFEFDLSKDGTDKTEFEPTQIEALTQFLHALNDREFGTFDELIDCAANTGNKMLLCNIAGNMAKFKSHVTPTLDFKEDGHGWKHPWVPNFIQDWFKSEFLKPANTRRRALVVYGKRGCAKTYFFTNCISKNPKGKDNPIDNPSLIYFRNEFQFKFYEMHPNAKLVICDDMHFNKDGTKYFELLKSLFSGQPYVMNTKFSLGATLPLPVVYLTNDINHFFHLATSVTFEKDAYFYRMKENEYLCPPEITDQIEEGREVKRNFDDATDEDFAQFLERKRERQKKFNY